MASQHVSEKFVIGGTGVQGVPIVKALVSDKKYQVRVLTREASSCRAKELLALGNVELLQDTLENEQSLPRRLQRLRRSNIDNRERMGASLLTVAPYIDIAIGSQTPMTPTIEDGVIIWRVPLSDTPMPLGSLEDCCTLPMGANADPNDPSTMTGNQNFTGFWNAFEHYLFKIDYPPLDEIHPGRVKSAESSGKGGLWERVQPENISPVLKRGEDGGRKLVL
ncbi:hypothetical protein V8C42DRAFT_355172 [Trichoderma barbatum]